MWFLSGFSSYYTLTQKSVLSLYTVQVVSTFTQKCIFQYQKYITYIQYIRIRCLNKTIPIHFLASSDLHFLVASANFVPASLYLYVCDYILVRIRDRKRVNDSKVTPNVCIDTDHRPVTIPVSRHKKRHMNKRTAKS